MPAPAGDYQTPLVAGWNMIGNPYSRNLDFSATKVIFGGTEYDLDTSNQKRYTTNYAWGYDSAAGFA